jgi:hypothetical protein
LNTGFQLLQGVKIVDGRLDGSGLGFHDSSSACPLS